LREVNNEKIIQKQLEEAIKLKKYLQNNTKVLETLAEIITKVFENGGKLVLFGNGGSASDAQHIAAELVGKYYLARAPLPAISLTGNISALTAIANDMDYADIFARQVGGLVKKGDAVIGLSTSGNSLNVIRGIEEAKKLGATAIAFTGEGGKLKDIADHVLTVPSSDTPRIQEAHITAGHIICYLVEKALFGTNSSK
jgi:D-sedoheptulose 7-phosphate isomerase